ncbi:protein vav-like isoform X1 [Diorhabda carinulata]|uniref:protein vav-like isoform X1 n=1 Tax=Diorhabda carinulata TaxID=1163345 RepID=UPI0025A1EEFF|nr:protein vav-like isoform X1 [Diorhabda carinulata]
MATASFVENDTMLNNDELWRECAAWLTRWEILRPDHKANWPSASIVDLANILRDGVLLCKLLNKIDPGCIDMKDVNLKPTLAQFLCLRNINLFLRICEKHFGLKQADLFEDTMLFDLTNFHKVLCTLSKLSLCSRTLRSRIPGFAAQKLKREEEVIFQSLKNVDIALQTDTSYASPSWLQFRIPCPQSDDWEEEVYGDLCYVTLASPLPEQPQPTEKRDFVIKELLDTEKNYVDVLEKLRKNFMLPLTNQMSPEHHMTVFFKIKELKDVHSEFLDELLKIRTHPNVKISNIFMRFREKFLVYGMYCANLTKATSILQELCETQEVYNQIIIKYEKEDNNGKFKLRDVLSVPMQRILKYHLLLEKLIEHTSETHEEYNDLKRAKEAMLDVAGYINEVARDSEHLDVINNLQDTITEWNLMPSQKLTDYGRLVKDASLRIKAHDDQKNRNRYVFIFDKCILICKQLKGNQFAFRDLINIADYRVDEIHNRPILNKEARSFFQFCLVKNDNQNAYTVSLRTAELKQQIIKAINDCINNLRPKSLKHTNHNFELHTFPQPTQCVFCSKFLKGLISQGYKCSTCGISVHKDCIQKSGKCFQTLHFNNSTSNGLNDPLSDKLWFVGEMDRNKASMKLERRENGTFMVRLRPQSGQNDIYALTLKTDTVKHMKICCVNEFNRDSKKYYLSQSKFFNSIEELVLNYQNYGLNENFKGLAEDTRLLWPFRQLRAIVIRNYDAKDQYQISVRGDEVVTIIGKEGYKEGFWKVRTINSEIGFVPHNVLRVDGEVRFDC